MADQPDGVPMALADTSIFLAREDGRPLLAAPPERVAVSVVTIGELRAALLTAPDTATRARRLRTLTAAAAVTPLPVDEAVVTAWAELLVALREAGTLMPINDSWIAATALVHRLPVATTDDDFDVVPGLTVVKL
jgi:predicted nucleic acid-binding protein